MKTLFGEALPENKSEATVCPLPKAGIGHALFRQPLAVLGKPSARAKPF